jgi:Putative Actinobacterial Holin-X, holin superfamily III
MTVVAGGGIQDSVRKLQSIGKAQGILLRGQVRRVVRTIVFSILSLVFFILAIGGLHYAAFAALERSYGSVTSALLVGGGDLLLAVVLLFLGQSSPSDTEAEQLARELTQASLESLGQDVDDVREELREFVGDIRLIRDAVGFVRTLLGAPLQLILQLFSLGKKSERSDRD